MDPKGKTALVTGAAHRVGRGLALGMAQAGANVVINYNSSEEEAAETAEMVAALGVGALPFKADIADHRQVEAMAQAARERFGGVDILVNNASIFTKTPVPTTNFEAWHQVTRVLIDGAFYVANAVAPDMLAKGQGAMVFIVDLSAWEAWPGYTGHAVGKSGMLALSRQLALELAPAVRVNAVAPGPTLPPVHYSPEKVERTSHKTLLGRWGSPADIAQAVLYFVQADYVTGEVIAVDGGERYGHRKYEEG